MKPLPLVRHCRRTALFRRQCRTTLFGYRQTQSRYIALAHEPLRPPQRWQHQPRQSGLNTNYRRSFHLPDLSSLLLSSNSSNNVVTATRTLPYPPETLYKVISSVESYSQFLPFLTASTVTARDPETNYPTRAFLTVGYGPLTETFTSEVRCDKSNWVVEAKSGARFADQRNPAGAAEGIFEYLNTKWVLQPLSGTGTRVDLEIALEFQNRMHAAMLGAVKGEMAGVMIEAFERRVREIGT